MPTAELDTSRIEVCVATYRRPALLARLLQSLHDQQLPEGTDLAVIVVDNDPEQSAGATVQAAIDRGWPVRYFTQPEKNISLTRNVAVAQATADLIAFIDDDETAPPRWLAHLLRTLQTTEAAAVIGPVQGELPPDAPAWVRSGGFFDAQVQATGSQSLRGTTNNALVRRRLIPDPQHAFDPAYGLTGGEDTDFFERLKTRGGRLVWCQEALVTEDVPPDRATLRWILRRDFRSGQSFADILGRPRRIAALLPWTVYRSGLVLVAALGTAFSWPFSRARGVWCAKKVATNLGQLSTLTNQRLAEYRAAEPRPR